tara:strand:- start:5415 stop:6023 length:609 start_codon:yes stop_codon:yes gene_type:complete
MFLIKIIFLALAIFLTSCNSNRTEEEMEELWSKAQTRNQIIERSGTKFNSAIDMDLAMRDAETRLQTGGGLLGKGGLSLGGVLGNDQNSQDSSVSVRTMPINVFLWKGALDTINFMPLTSADPIGGTIITDWYSTSNNQFERCKLNIFISGKALNAENLKVTSFCQKFKDQIWVNTNIDENNNIKIENAILNKAKKLRIQSS